MSKAPFRDSAGNSEEPRRTLYTVFIRVYEVVRKPFVSPKPTAREVEVKNYVEQLAKQISGIVETRGDVAMAEYVREMMIPPTATSRSEDWTE